MSKKRLSAKTLAAQDAIRNRRTGLLTEIDGFMARTGWTERDILLMVCDLAANDDRFKALLFDYLRENEGQ